MPTDDRYDHATGRGHVLPTDGRYGDAIHNKRSSVTIVLVETTGAVCEGYQRKIRKVARVARASRGVDRTKYSSHFKTAFLTHHMQALSLAAVVTDARCIVAAAMERQAKLLEPTAPPAAGSACPPSPARM